ncbi:SDR family oxidoreductase [Salinirubellus sp. GCM10025818]|jgi:NAD(P)-dependent dehydrogenase (short-subunit alcohol dehydrogenase family)|uniref:SDR family oxidoreductase n=1 Tax=Salinirubellus TaxID=2162630 RepID=UPI0030CFFBDC
MSDWLENEVAVVTGGSSGNGRSIALTLAEYGADVVVVDLQAEPREGGTPTHERIRADHGRDATFVECDVSSVSEIREAVDAADEFGGVTVMVNNAGITHSDDFLEATEAEYDRLMDVNVKGVFFGAQAAARRMVEAERSGSIVNVSSIAGLVARGDGVRYSASKGAVRLMTYAQAGSLGPRGIRVNAVHPGLVETSMTRDDLEVFRSDSAERFRRETPLRQICQPQDVANAVLYLASPLASFVNGESLTVDGGVTNTMGGWEDG